MKNIILAPKLIAALSLIFALASCQNSSNSNLKTAGAGAGSGDVKDQSQVIVATYFAGDVTLKDVNFELEKIIAKNDKLKDLTFDKLSQEQKEAIIKEVVLKEMAYREAKRKSLNKEKDYQEALKSFELELLKQKLFVTLVKEATDEKNVQKNYDELVAQLKDKKDLRISYIVLKTQSEAESVYQAVVKSPNSFAAIARKKSSDKETAKKGGDLGFVIEDALPADVLKQAKNLQKGQIAKPFFMGSQSLGKWVVIKLADERPVEILPYEKAKEALAQNLAKKAMEDFASQSFEKAKISILVK